MRSVLMAVVAAGVLLGSAAPAAPPDYPVNFIKVDELKALLDKGTKADIIDVRTWAAYEEMHIKGARSMPRAASSSSARTRSRRRISSSCTEPARTRWPVGPATSSTRWAGATSASSTKACPGWADKRYPVEGKNPSAQAEPLTCATTAELARAARMAFEHVSAPAGRAGGRGLRRLQRLAALAAELHLAHPLQRRRRAEVHRVVRHRAPGRLRRPGGARLGFGSEPSDLTRARRRARARAGAHAPPCSTRSSSRSRAPAASAARWRAITTRTDGVSDDRAWWRRAGRSSTAPCARSSPSSPARRARGQRGGAAPRSASSSAATPCSSRSAWPSPPPPCPTCRPTSPR